MTEAKTADYQNTVVDGEYVETNEDGFVFDVEVADKAVVDPEEFGDREPFENGDVEPLLVEETDNNPWDASVRKARKLELWEWLEDVADRDVDVEGQIIAKNKGGLSVNIGVRAFCPRSHIDFHEIDDLGSLIGEQTRFHILQFDQDRCNIVVSRKKYLEKTRGERKQQTLEELEEGKVFEGIVRSIKDYGAFVDIGGIDGLLHVSNLSWGRLEHPGEVLDEGDSLEVVVLEFDEDEERISLGRKQLVEDPWERVETELQEGDTVQGEVVSLTNFGAFIEVREGVEGLAHITELSWNKGLSHPGQILDRGQQVQTKVLSIDPEERRISLSLKRLEPNPWDEFADQYSEGDVVEGTVQNITDFGIFVEIEPDIEGLVHVSDISWTENVDSPDDYVESGEQIEVKILDINVEKQRVGLGIKQLTENPWDKAEKIAEPGEHIEVTVTRLADFGAFAEVVEGVEGLIHISELAPKRVERVQDVVKPGDEVDVVVTDFDRKKGRIGLSRKKELIGDEMGDATEYTEAEDISTTLGDMLGDQLEGASAAESEDGD